MELRRFSRLFHLCLSRSFSTMKSISWLKTSLTGGATFFHVFWQLRTFLSGCPARMIASDEWFLSHSVSTVSGSYSGIENTERFLYFPPLGWVISSSTTLPLAGLNKSWNSSLTLFITSNSGSNFIFFTLMTDFEEPGRNLDLGFSIKACERLDSARL